ncbi:thioredoxin [Candidatus Woesearchaeota archaeon]|nr:thioredoxin [Candidatus Woesearchaeota archaeon]
MGNVVNLTDQNFEKEVTKADTPVIVDFWAEWCGPCKMMAPVFEELAGDYKGKGKFAKLDTDKFPQVSGSHGVQGIPTLIVFKGGKEIGRIVGFAPKDQLKHKIDEIVS